MSAFGRRRRERPSPGTAAIVRLAAAAAAALSAAGCRAASSGAPVPSDALQLVEVAGGLSNPLHLTAPAGDERLFIVEQAGRVQVVKGSLLLARPFLDITSQVLSGGEHGLLSVAFHPRYAENGYMYVNYTDRAGDTRVERYTVSAADPDAADPASAHLVLTVAQPYANHNGGLVLFGPDGMLYVGMGDGGSGGDPHGYGQSKATLLGKLLRLDVDGAQAGAPYAIPPDNPFAGEAGSRGEIWALGLRNPWRFAFDRAANLIYVADVGQNRWEEVHVAPANRSGVNYGWSVLEGSECFGGSPLCNAPGLERPVVEYSHAEGCSIIGGFAYRGRRIPAIAGHYFYSDLCAGFLRSFRYAGGSIVRNLRNVRGNIVEQRTWDVGNVGQVLSFGEDANGELYVLSANGRVYRLEAR
ncbi:MAG: sorbosone dehydrogenase family protein [Gemmatimonadaceae bacterium]